MVNQETIRKKIEDGTFSAADIPELFEVFSKILSESEGIQKNIENWNRKFNFNLGNSADFWLDVENGRLNFGMGKIENPDLIYTISEEKAIKMFTGQMDGSHLSTSGDMKFDGDLNDALKLGILNTLILGELDISPIEKEIKDKELKKTYKLTKEDNKKIKKSWAVKGDAIIKGGALLSKLTAETKNSIGLRVEENAKKYPDKLALLYKDIQYTHKEFNEMINRYSNYFLELGLKKGDIAVVFLENRPETMFIIVAMAKIGVISSLINTNQREKPLIHSITHTTGRVFIIGEELTQAFEDIKSRLDLDDEQKQKIFFLPEKGKIKTPKGYINLIEKIKDSDVGNPPTTPEIQAKDAYAYIFTSGTTGLPKAAIITNRHTLTAMTWWGDMVVGMKLDDVMYITTPIFHSNAINVAFASALSKGSAMAISRKFSASNFWDETRKFNATCFNYVGEICRYLYNQPPKPDDAENPIVKIVGNGLRNDIWLDFKKRFNISEIREFYGATEVNIPTFANIHNLDQTCGVCLSAYAIVKYNIEADEPIRNEKGFMQRIKSGDVGLLLGQIEDPDSFYMYKDSKATEKKIFRDVLKKGDMYITTGDLLRDIGYGHVQFVDRLGDTFRWKGENISTEEVEAVINTFDQIEFCSVYGVLIPNTEGRAGMVSIVKKTESEFNFKGFLNLMKKYLPHYAIPLFIRFKRELDITATLKIQKVKLKKEGYNIIDIREPTFVLLPGSSEYVTLTKEIYDGISDGKYRF